MEGMFNSKRSLRNNSRPCNGYNLSGFQMLADNYRSFVFA